MTDPRLLDPAVIQRAELLGLNARQIVEGHMAGAHKSPLRGMAVEFAQHREYTPGDDLRHLDYKVLGRTDRHYIKQYEQETNFVAHLLLDGSESMQYGSGAITKFEYARQMAATLAYLILLQRDAVAVSIFDSAVWDRQPRTDNIGRIHDILLKLAAFDPGEQTDIGRILNDLAVELKRKGIVILISDLLDDEERVLKGIQHLLFGGHEVLIFHVMDHAEIDFPFTGSVEFVGLERLSRLTTQPAAVRKSYCAEVQAFRDRVRIACERNRCHYVFVDTSQPWGDVLSRYLAFKRKKHGGPKTPHQSGSCKLEPRIIAK
ncbi:MAG: DUF58 domain-containing protein [Chthoniobacteraceae bacterium]|jgi:uncharacterized protein (DUF58 family)